MVEIVGRRLTRSSTTSRSSFMELDKLYEEEEEVIEIETDSDKDSDRRSGSQNIMHELSYNSGHINMFYSC